MAEATRTRTGPPPSRRRLWELPAASHDWLVALSLPPPLLKSLVEHALSRVKRAPVRLQGRESDVLYSVVHDLASRNAVSEAVEQALQARHAAAVRSSKALDGAEALRAHWCAVLEQGEPAALVAAAWALLTHPVGAEIEAALLYDARALGFAWARRGQRSELDPARAQAALEAALRAERERTQALQQRLAALHAEREAERRAQAEAVASLRGELQRWRQQAEALQAAEKRAPAPPQAAAATPSPSVRAAEAEAQPALKRLRPPAPDASGSRSPSSGGPAGQLVAPAAGATATPPALCGRRVLCVGGMPGARERYRALVEGAGARFAFHDGGLEQSVQRLDGQLDAADLVVCQAGCLNHEAYHRVKGHCRRAGKPCLFVERPSLASFARTLGLGPAHEAPASA